MKRNLLLFSASAALCLAWPLAAAADQKSDQTEPSEPQADQPHKKPAEEGARPAPKAQEISPRQGPAPHAPPGKSETGGAAGPKHLDAPPEAKAEPPAAHGGKGPAPAAASAGRSAQVASLKRNVQASKRFHAAAYQPPQGYAPRHWGYGEQLPGAYFASTYWITNFSLYGLLAPPSGLVWVRVGDDVLLIDQYSGEIIQVDYGVFY